MLTSFYASITYTRDNQINCRCAPRRSPLSAPAACGRGDSFLYSHGVPSRAISRRDQQLVLEAEKDGEQPCPDGMKACLVPYAKDKSAECINMQTELESCGGCLFGEVGFERFQNKNTSGTE
ncbi:hypothetical protein IAT40_007265 [Kwoniella sp. CBS 6097]